MVAPSRDATLDIELALRGTVGSLIAGREPRVVSYKTALWVARAGRVAAIWLPIWALSIAWFPGPSSLAASLVLLVVWKVALRRAYADANVTIWTIGAAVPAAVGAIAGAIFVALLVMWIPFFHLSATALSELTAAVFSASVLWESTVANSLAARRRVLLVGSACGGSDLLEDVSLAPRLPFEVIGVVDDPRTSDQIAGVPLHTNMDDLPSIVESERPQIIVLASGRCRARALEGLLEVGHLGFSLVELPEFYEYAFGRLPVRSLTPEWFMSILDLYRRPYPTLTKRTFDLLVAGLAALAVTPL